MKIIRQNHFGTTIVHVLKDTCEIVAILDTQLLFDNHLLLMLVFL